MKLDDLLPPPPATPPTATERARILTALREGLHAETSAERRAAARRSRVAGVALPALLVGCVGAVVAMALVLVLVPGPAPTDEAAARPVVASAPAAAVLETAARQVAAADPVAPSPDQFVYVRSVALTNEGSIDGPITLDGGHDREIWLAQDPVPGGTGGLIREFGQDWPLGSGSPADIRRPTYAFLSSLPLDPDDLLDELTSQISTGADTRSRDQVLFETIVDLVTEGLAPGDTTAALYHALIRIPGVAIDGDARDLLGRPGVAVTRTEDTTSTHTVLIIDPASGEAIGARYLMSTPSGDEVFGAIAVTARGVTDVLGRTPDDLHLTGGPTYSEPT